MAISIIIPRLGWNMEEGTFIAWLKPDGATIRAGESLFTLESEKATEDVECLDAGILRIPPDGPNEGDKLPVGTVIGYLVQADEVSPWEASGRHGDKETRRQGDKETETPMQVAADLPVSLSPGLQVSLSVAKASPRAKRVARELGIDWTHLQGSGRTGRIRERDVRAVAAHAVVPSVPAQDTTVAVSTIRRTIADRMMESRRCTAPVTLTTTVDVSNLVNLRNQFKAVSGVGEAVVPSYTDFLVKLTASALQKHPLLNARWSDERIVMSPGIHIGIAVDTDAGLLVPVVRNVPAVGLKILAVRTRYLAERARQRRLTAEELQDGTFTVTNLGAFGIDAFTPIINYPQCAILGVGRIERRPVVIGEKIEVREQIALSLTFDHRIVDGAPAARFLQTLSTLIENPGPWLMA